MSAVSVSASRQLERSRRMIAARFPVLAKALETPPASTPVFEGEAVTDIDFGPSRLYREDARVMAARQVEDYLTNPARYARLAPIGDNVAYGIGQRMFAVMGAACRELGVGDGDLATVPEIKGGLLVVLGCGLGYHLPELVRRLRPGYLVVYEPYVEFLGHALAAFDWQDFVASCDDISCKISLIWASDAETAAKALFFRLGEVPKPFIDGAYVFCHYPAPSIITLRDGLGPWFDHANQSLGFFEDELRMFTNTVANLKSRDFRLLEATPVPHRREPLFIVGAGPSLASDLPALKRLREGAIVISCGTTLRALLAAGITPDFHCENENVPETYGAYLKTGEDFSLAGITLIGALTVDPRSTGLFETVWAYFRADVTPTRMFADPDKVLTGSTPNVANTALRAAVAMGFRNINLIGIDLGVKPGDRVHAPETVYDTLPEFYEYERTLTFTHQIPANFGGQIGTDPIFDLTRIALEALIARERLPVVNCSDGARIAGAAAIRAAALPPLRPLDRARVIAEIGGLLLPCQASHYPFRDPVATALAESEAYFRDLTKAVRRAGKGKDIIAIYHAIHPFAEGERRGKVGYFVSASLISLYKVGLFFITRLRDPAHRCHLFMRFLDEYLAIIALMRDQTIAALRTGLEQ